MKKRVSKNKKVVLDKKRISKGFIIGFVVGIILGFVFGNSLIPTGYVVGSECESDYNCDIGEYCSAGLCASADEDNDGYQGVNGDNLDCNDFNSIINPSAPEMCDGIDNNCNDLI